MRILVVAATRPEVAPLLGALHAPVEAGNVVTAAFGAHDVSVLLTGVGMVATGVWCARVLAAERYDLVFNFGVCGSFNASLPPPTAVHVMSDALPELGAEDGPRFLTLQEIGLLEPDGFPFSGGRLVNPAPPLNQSLGSLPVAAGITVNTVHGNELSIAAIRARCPVDVESMEGAAFMYACRVAGVCFAQVRTVSNMVERRNRERWDLAGAVQELGRVAVSLLEAA
jgi:futalosine hydrolase